MVFCVHMAGHYITVSEYSVVHSISLKNLMVQSWVGWPPLRVTHLSQGIPNKHGSERSSRAGPQCGELQTSSRRLALDPIWVAGGEGADGADGADGAEGTVTTCATHVTRTPRPTSPCPAPFRTGLQADGTKRVACGCAHQCTEVHREPHVSMTLAFR